MAKSILKIEGEVEHARKVSPLLKRVCWGDLEILEFPNMLGDNPGVSEGAPLTINWQHESREVVAIEYYEYLRQNRPRRRRKDLVMNSASRDTYLLGLGYRLDELIQAAEETKKIRKSRQANMKGKLVDKFRGLFDFSSVGNSKVKKSNAQPKIVAGKSA
jgi:hypothetical protein